MSYANMLKFFNSVTKVNYISRSFSVCRILCNEDSNKPKVSKRKVKETVELITLVDINDKILGLKPKKESELLAKKLNLSLERVTDTKYGKSYPAYKMFSPTELLKTEKKASTAKTLKKLPINSRISDNDLLLKLNIVRKWLAKNCEVHIAVVKNNEPETTMKKMFSHIKEQLRSEGRILDIRHKEDSIKFIILPPKQTSSKNTAKNNEIKENLTEEN